MSSRVLLMYTFVSLGSSACGDDAASTTAQMETLSSGASMSSATTPATETDGPTDSEAGETSASSGVETDSQDSTADSQDPSTDSQDPTTEGQDPTTDTDEGTKFDLGAPADAGAGNCEGDEMLSYIWIANSEQNTISKINTKTLVEEGRYFTKMNNGLPSRTSVSLAGDVAVANRYGGVTKVLAAPERCDEMNNGIPGLQTSSGGEDILEWGMDDCVAWYTPIDHTSNRPIAWTAGIVDEVACTVVGAKVWTGAASVAGVGLSHVLRLDGETGVIEDDVLLDGFEASHWGPYGGAVDSQDNFWTVSLESGNLSRVDAETLEVSTWVAPPMYSYGFTVDEYDRPWISAPDNRVAVSDPETETWTTLDGGGLGLGQSASGVMWQAAILGDDQLGIRGRDIDTFQIIQEITVPGITEIRGVSVDIDGYVWLVEIGDEAFKIDPQSETWDTFSELVGAYTYSDMTGNALSLVAGGIAG